MKNIEISNIFSNISEFLQIRGDASFRIRSYEKAARVIADLTVDVGELIEANKFQSIPGIGKTIEDKTKEIIETGTCQAYEKLIDEMGLEALDLLKIQGIGSKTAHRLYYEYGILNLEHLKKAYEDGRLQSIKGLGKKTVQTISDSLIFFTEYQGIRVISISFALSDKLSEILDKCSDIARYDITGDLRRREEIVRSLEVVVECSEDIQTTHDAIIGLLSENKQILHSTIVEEHLQQKEGPWLQSIRTVNLCIDNDFPVIIYLSDAAEYEAIKFLTTASNEHLQAFPSNDENSLSEPNNINDFLQQTQNKSEAEIFQILGMSYIPPELRKYSDSVSLALVDKLPTLLELDDMKGDLHSHTEWSDGRNTMDEMIATAVELGLEYFAITDHSVSSTVANGLDQKRLLAQIKHIHETDAANQRIKLLAGSEVDIRKDGSLDFPDEILEQLDIVIASIHSHFTLTETEMTKRMISAIENPFVNVIGHPTGRLIGSRPGYSINLDEIIHAAAENNTVLEINGSPSRLDLEPKYVRKAKDLGVLISINTDAHAVRQFIHREYGVNVARRSGLTKEDVINTYSYEKLQQILK